MGYSKAPEQPQSSTRPICHSHAMTRTGREPATIRIAALELAALRTAPRETAPRLTILRYVPLAHKLPASRFLFFCKSAKSVNNYSSCCMRRSTGNEILKKQHHPYEKVPWYSHGATMVYHGKQWYTVVQYNCTMVQITCTMVDYGIPWYILTVPWHILVHPWFTELVPWCIMIYHGATLHNHSTIYL